MKEPITFLRETKRNFKETGAVWPSSRILAERMVSKVSSPDRRPLRVLEVGAGTGAFTRSLVKRLGPADHLDIYEINPSFASHLRQTFVDSPESGDSGPQIGVFEKCVLTLDPEEKYDFIVSGLPFNSLSPGFVSDVLERYRNCLRPGGSLTYFEYLFIRRLTRPFGSREYRRRVQEIDDVVSGYIEGCQFDRDTVFLNIPPAVVRHLRFAEASSGD